MLEQNENKFVSTLSFHLLDMKRVFGNLANQTTDFMGVQSNLQFSFNYRRKNMRLEIEFFAKSDEIKDFQG